MEPKAIMYNGKVVVAVPDEAVSIMVIRKDGSYNITLPKDELIKKNYLHDDTLIK